MDIQLSIKNFRGIQEQTMTLESRMNVLVGENGAGKTTILDAFALVFSWVVSRIQAPNAKGEAIRELDIYNGKPFAQLLLEYGDFEPTPPLEFRMQIVQARRGRNSRENGIPFVDYFDELDEWADAVRDKIGTTDGECNLPLFAYYPVDRVVVEIPLNVRDSQNFELLEAYDGALSSRARFHEFFNWYRNREDLENELRAQAGPFVPDVQLDAVRNALSSFLPNFSGVSVKRDPLRMVATKNGETMRVDQMSDGEKCLFAMVGDLARRLAIANPVLDNPLQGAGVVLIDEIDLHLHPRWQPMVIPNLKETFPNCTFLISTHSPQVVTHVNADDSLFMLSRGTSGVVCSKVPDHYGQTAVRVLEDLMGLPTTRPVEVAERLDGIYDLIDEKNLDAARNEIASLKLSIGEDPDLVRADVLIKRMELIGK